MKLRFLPLFAAPLLAASPVLANLDFTLQHKLMPADGIMLDEIYITDAGSKIFLRLPPNWKAANNAQALECTPVDPGIRLRLEPFPMSKKLTIDAAGGRELVNLATSQLPGDARNVVALPVEINSLPLFGWTTLEVTFRYDYFGQPTRRSVMYLNMLPGRQVEMTVVAPEESFDKVRKQARQFMGTWFEPSRDLPPELQSKYAAPATGGT